MCTSRSGMLLLCLAAFAGMVGGCGSRSGSGNNGGRTVNGVAATGTFDGMYNGSYSAVSSSGPIPLSGSADFEVIYNGVGSVDLGFGSGGTGATFLLMGTIAPDGTFDGIFGVDYPYVGGRGFRVTGTFSTSNTFTISGQNPSNTDSIVLTVRRTWI